MAKIESARVCLLGVLKCSVIMELDALRKQLEDWKERATLRAKLIDEMKGELQSVRAQRDEARAEAERWKAACVVKAEEHGRTHCERDGLKAALQGLINKCNGVTAYHRHGNTIPEKALVELYDRQLEAENALWRR